MKRGILVVAVVLGVFLYMHRALLHEIFIDTAVSLGGVAGLCLLAAGWSARQRGRRARPVRYRTAALPAAVTRPRASRPGDPCAEACGRPATRMFEQWPVCGDCGGRLDAAAGHARRPAGWPGTLPQPADLPALTQPPVLPAGETIGTIDMSQFEESA